MPAATRADRQRRNQSSAFFFLAVFPECLFHPCNSPANPLYTLFQLMDNLGGYVSEQRRAEMSSRYPQKR